MGALWDGAAKNCKILRHDFSPCGGICADSATWGPAVDAISHSVSHKELTPRHDDGCSPSPLQYQLPGMACKIARSAIITDAVLWILSCKG